MTRTSLFVLAVALSAISASAQNVVAPVGSANAASAAASAGAASRSITATPNFTPSLTPVLSVSPLTGPSAQTAAPIVVPAGAAPAAVSLAAPAALQSAVAVPAPALPHRLAAGDGPTPLQEPIRPGERWHGADPRMGAGDELVHDGPRGRVLVPLSSFEPSEEPMDWRSTRSRSNRAFDGSAVRKDLADQAPVAGKDGSAAAPLAKASAPAPRAANSVPSASAPARSRGWSLATKIALGAALFLLTPGIALAAPAGAPITVAGTIAIMAAIRPAAAALGAIAGAVYGMVVARPKDGSEASSGEMMASVLRYGALGGASVFMLLDVTSLAFAGPAAGGLQPLSSAVVTAALGRTAFQGKFMDAATTSADRIVGAFPAVAAALGISLGVTFFVAPPLATTIALGAMTFTGVATALYTALFKLGRSPLDGPSKMAKGFVLQALMTGLALAVSSPYLFWFFAAMGAAGFGLVLWAMGSELLSFLPGRAVPAPPAPPAPPPAPPGPKA